MMSESRADREKIKSLLRLVVLAPDEFVSLREEEMDLALRVSRRVRLLGRVAACLKSAGKIDSVPQSAADQLTSALVIAESRARLALWELERIDWALGSAAPEPMILLKGCVYVLLGLPNSAGRVFADVDLMTTEAALETVESVLIHKGWKSITLTSYDDRYYRRWTHELPPLVHVRREVEIDLHHNLLPRTARISPPAMKLLKASKPIPGSRYRSLSEVDMTLHAIVHLFFDSDLADKLRDLVDIFELLDHFAATDPYFWRRFVDRAQELGLQRSAYYGLHFAREVFDYSLPGTVETAMQGWAPPRLIIRMMNRLVPRALFPVHPDRRSPMTELCRFLLYLRSHWIRMPPWLLAYHLTHKALIR